MNVATDRRTHLTSLCWNSGACGGIWQAKS